MLFLMEKGIIPLVTREEIRSSKKPEDINEVLLTKLKYNSGTMAFNMLIKGLQNTDQASLACLLLEESQLKGKNKMQIIAVCGTNDLTQN